MNCGPPKKRFRASAGNKPVLNLYPVSMPSPNEGTGKITKTVDGQTSCLSKTGNEKAEAKMRVMMFRLM